LYIENNGSRPITAFEQRRAWLLFE